jgi:hypothetical protein
MAEPARKEQRPSRIWIPQGDKFAYEAALRLCGYDSEKYELEEVTGRIIPKEDKGASK